MTDLIVRVLNAVMLYGRFCGVLYAVILYDGLHHSDRLISITITICLIAGVSNDLSVYNMSCIALLLG